MDSHNPYASPPPDSPAHAGAGTAQQVSRSANLLVVGHGAVLPNRCVKCNAPADGYKRRIKLSWHSPLIYLFVLVGPLIYVLVALVCRKRLSVRVGLCPLHVSKRRAALWLTTLAVLADLGLMVPAASVDKSGILVLLLAAALVGVLVYGVVASRIVAPTRITPELAWVKGVCPKYLAELPEYGESAAPILPRRSQAA